MDGMHDGTLLKDAAALRELYGEPSEPALAKELDYVHPHYRAMIEASPFVVMATSGPDGLDVSPRGCTLKTSRRARSSQVMTMTSSPGRMLPSPSSISGSKTSHAAGAPSSACRGVDAGSVRGDSTLPITFSSNVATCFSL